MEISECYILLLCDFGTLSFPRCYFYTFSPLLFGLPILAGSRHLLTKSQNPYRTGCYLVFIQLVSHLKEDKNVTSSSLGVCGRCKLNEIWAKLHILQMFKSIKICCFAALNYYFMWNIRTLTVLLGGTEPYLLLNKCIILRAHELGISHVMPTYQFQYSPKWCTFTQLMWLTF